MGRQTTEHKPPPPKKQAKSKTKKKVVRKHGKKNLVWTHPVTGKRFEHIVKTYPGRPKAFSDPNELWTMMCAYIEDYYEDPEGKYMSMAELAGFLGVSRETLNEYRRGSYDEGETKYSDAIELIRTVIEGEKLKGAGLRIFESGISKFDLINNHGYSDKIVQEHTGKGGAAIQHEDVTDIEFVRRFLWMLHESKKEKGDEK